MRICNLASFPAWYSREVERHNALKVKANSASDKGAINQCNGCRQKLPVTPQGIHVRPKTVRQRRYPFGMETQYEIVMACEKEKYA